VRIHRIDGVSREQHQHCYIFRFRLRLCPAAIHVALPARPYDGLCLAVNCFNSSLHFSRLQQGHALAIHDDRMIFANITQRMADCQTNAAVPQIFSSYIKLHSRFLEVDSVGLSFDGIWDQFANMDR
jgi:hypothetical protein